MNGRIVRYACLAALVLVVGCSRGAKKDAEFRPGGEWLDGMRASVEKVVADDDRKAKMIVLLDRIQQELEALDADVVKNYEDWTELDRDPATTRETFDAAYDKFEAVVDSHRDVIFEAGFELKALATREEWKELGKQDKTLYETWRQRYVMPQ